MTDRELTIRSVYKALRTHGSPIAAGQARSFMRRAQGPRHFVAGPSGTLRTDDRAALLAELRLLALRQFPVAYVTKLDR